MFENAVQIDPLTCGCTECITHEYVPLEFASAEQVYAMIQGQLSNATSEQFSVSTITGFPLDRGVTIEIRAEYCGRTWTIEQETP